MSSTPLRRALVRSLRRTPWSPGAWRDTRLIAAGIPIALPVWLGVTESALLFPVLVLVLGGTRPLTALQRGRLRALHGVEVPPPRPAGGWHRWLLGLTWRQSAYHLVVGPLLAVGALAVLYAWGAGLVMACTYGWIWLLPSGGLRSELAGLDVAITLCGVLLLAAAPWLAALAAWLEVRAAGLLLGPNRAERLERRVEEVTESRAGLVDAVDAERRRIERDLHDGAQQRLTSLAMNLGLARRTLKDVLPPEAMQVIVAAHEEAQAAIDELRDLVRGLHPAVLEDRGLDAALSGIAARAPLPVRLDVDLSEPVSPTVEAVAYFTVSEALTNVAKHARARRVDLSVRTAGGRLRLVVSDDGVGGADPAGGTGLTGLRKRTAAVDGTLSVLSPLGGPTTITVELPCVL
ncbi:histidine kinase [Kitasatospora sp. NPDC004745]|uniref:sensor histidine kinase n=1 Tax=Kitasatospora sp. NPDC004745 TaxID=3364019 RepID=UPI00367C08AA